MSDFVHLHNHTDFSLLDGAASIPRLIQKAKELGMDSLAITDHGNMFGALDFYKECKANGIKPIIGNEFYVAPGSMKLKSGTEDGNKYYHLILLAKDSIGYSNLIKLTSIAYIEGFYYKPRIDFETLKQYSNNLVCCSACVAGLIPSLILDRKAEEALKIVLEYDALFGRGNFFLELQDHGIPEQKIVNQALCKISEKTGIPLVATNDIHYVNKEEAEAQEILICIGTQKKLSDTKRLVFDKKEYYLKSSEEMKQLFKAVPDAIENTKKIADMCNIELKLPGPLLPDFEIPRDFNSPDDYLSHIAQQGLKKRYEEITPEIQERVDYELKTIISMGFTGYFLIVWDFIRYALENGIPVGPGRGSGTGSVVAYALFITNIDPFKYGLLFERFLNPERISMPDFDIDFCFERRQEVIDYVTYKYGSERVGQIITFGTLKAKAVLKDVARVLDIPFDEANMITKFVPFDAKNLDDAIGREDELKKVIAKGGKYQKLVDISRILEGLNRHQSLHAAGIVIGKEELTNYVPLYKDTRTGAVSTQFTMDKLEECGLVKMDILGLKTLTLIKNTEDLIRKKGIDFSIEKIPDFDEKTFRMLGEGKSACIFQFESPGMQKNLKATKPGSIEDLIALNALYRPGPMPYIPQFIDSKNGKIKIKYLHSSLEDVLKPTYGVIVYQEQAMQVARIIAGLSLGKADILRRAMGKKDVEKMAGMKNEFMEGAEKNGYSKQLAEDIFEIISEFAGYGFNKSHSAAYAVLAYQTAYLKANYPAEFMSANLTNEVNDTDKLSEYIAEAKSMGLEILPPDINLSERNFTAKDNKIIYGLIGIKNVGTAAVEEILRERNENGLYKSFTDFINRSDLHIINKKVLETVLKSGLFDNIEKRGRATLFNNLEKLVEIASREQENKKYGQTSLFDSSEKSELPEIELEEVPEWPEKELLEFEKENLGFYFSGHPLKEYKNIYDKCVTLKTNLLERSMLDRKYIVLGIVKAIKHLTTKKMEQFAAISIETYNGEISVVLFPPEWNKYKYLVLDGKILGFTVKVYKKIFEDKESFEPKLKCEKISEPEELDEAIVKEMHFTFFNNITYEDMDTFKSFLLEHNGNCQVFFHIDEKPNKEIVIKAAPQVTTASDDAFIKKVEHYPFVKSVWKE
ncbi:MAG: DNA polymerase III subunit alpha [Spirochaetaceae bacterium]|nr:DNA polymerase III subunit alpha [Spirochaetaceae bacterium]